MAYCPLHVPMFKRQMLDYSRYQDRIWGLKKRARAIAGADRRGSYAIRRKRQEQGKEGGGLHGNVKMVNVRHVGVEKNVRL